MDRRKRIIKRAPIYKQAQPGPRVRPIVNMKKTIAILVLAALAIPSANAGVYVGINLGIAAPAPVMVAPPPLVAVPAPVVLLPPMPAPIVEVAPAWSAPGYIWVGGNWGWCNNRWVWTRGYWGPSVHWSHGYGADYHGGYRSGHQGRSGRR